MSAVAEQSQSYRMISQEPAADVVENMFSGTTKEPDTAGKRHKNASRRWVLALIKTKMNESKRCRDINSITCVHLSSMSYFTSSAESFNKLTCESDQTSAISRFFGAALICPRICFKQSWITCAIQGTRIMESRELMPPEERRASCNARIRISLLVALSVVTLKVRFGSWRSLST